MRAIDFGSWSRVPTAQDFANLKPLDVRLAIVGTRGNRRKFLAQCAACLAAALRVEAYVYLYWNEPAVLQATKALELVKQVPEITRVWVDVEADDDNPVINNPRDTVDTVLATLQPYRTGIYTSQVMWAQIMQDSHAYAHLPLWDAAYGAENAAFVAYGGWLTRELHQYAGSTNIDGFEVDLNHIEENPMTADERKEFDELKATVLDLAAKTYQKIDAIAAALADHATRLHALDGK